MPAHSSAAPHNAPFDPGTLLHRLPSDSCQDQELRPEMILPDLPFCKDRRQQMAGVQHIVCKLHPSERLRLGSPRTSHELFEPSQQTPSDVRLPESGAHGEPLRLLPCAPLDNAMDQLQLLPVPDPALLSRRLISFPRPPVSDCHPAGLAADAFKETV